MVIICKSNKVGDGDLGALLMKSTFSSIVANINNGNFNKTYPLKKIVMFNEAVKMCASEDKEMIAILKELESLGIEIICCKTCLNYFELSGKLKVGIEGNSLDIVGYILSCNKVVDL